MELKQNDLTRENSHIDNDKLMVVNMTNFDTVELTTTKWPVQSAKDSQVT